MLHSSLTQQSDSLGFAQAISHIAPYIFRESSVFRDSLDSALEALERRVSTLIYRAASIFGQICSSWLDLIGK